MGKRVFIEPTHKNATSMVHFNCEICGKDVWQTRSHYDRENRHFCTRDCYSAYRKESLPMIEQHAYKGVRMTGESKQVYHRNYCKNNPETISHLKARRYAREKNADGSHTLQEWQSLKDKYNHRCAMCGREAKLTKDHVIPLSKGGTDYISNIMPLCRNCNSKKHNKILEHPHLLKQ